MGVTAVILTDEERSAASIVQGASRRELLNALTELPSYQRVVLRWLARAVLKSRDPSAGGPEYVTILERQRAKERARAQYEALEARLASAALPPEQQSAMHGHLLALWCEAEAAMGELGEPPLFPSAMTRGTER